MDINGILLGKQWRTKYEYIYIYIYWNTTIQLDMMYPCWSSRNFWGSMPGGLFLGPLLRMIWSHITLSHRWFLEKGIFKIGTRWYKKQSSTMKYNKYTKVQQEVDRNLLCIFPCVVPWLSSDFRKGYNVPVDRAIQPSKTSPPLKLGETSKNSPLPDLGLCLSACWQMHTGDYTVNSLQKHLRRSQTLSDLDSESTEIRASNIEIMLTCSGYIQYI